MTPADRPTTGIPPRTRYHRWLGWHALALRRAAVVASIGLLAGLALGWFVVWELAVIGGWDAAALAFLATVWPIVIRADSSDTAHLAMREDETRGSATVLTIGASVASLLGVGFALSLAGKEGGSGLSGGITFAGWSGRRSLLLV